MGELGLFGLPIAEEYGGQGGDHSWSPATAFSCPTFPGNNQSGCRIRIK
jgi:hypothetical protein